MASASTMEFAQTQLQSALQLHRAGRLAEAEALYLQVVHAQRANHEALHLLGVCQHALGNFAAAERSIRASLKLRPAVATAHLSYGNALRELGRLPEAIQSYGRAAGLDPRLALAHYNLGTALEEAGRPADAIASYDRALALGPHAPSQAGKANCLVAQGKTAGAAAAYEAALALDPELTDARVNLAALLGAMGRWRDATAQLQSVLSRQPQNLAALRSLAASLNAQGRPAEALEAVEALRARVPDDVELMILHARALSGRRRLPEAAELLERVVALQPHNPAAASDLASCLGMLGKVDRAAERCADAIARFPGDGQVQLTQGFIAFQTGDFERARATFDEVLERWPDIPRGRLHRALLHLLHGEFAAGWPLFEHRWNDPGGWTPGREFAQPQWRGETDPASEILLVHAEQGLGDTLQFCRYVPALAERAGTVVLEVPAPAFDLVRRAMPASVVVVRAGAPLPPFTRVCPLLSLPLVFGTTLETIPRAHGYLKADPGRLQRWNARLGPQRGPRIGIAWSGNPGHHNDRQRSLALERLRGVLQVRGPDGRPMEFVALQNEITDGDRVALESLPRLTYLGDAIEDLDDSAALAELCDLVISVDTSAAHLAGALGRPLWVLLPHVPDWRWLLEREDSPWYPSARLFRQASRGGDWDPVVARVESALAGFVRQAAPVPAG
jgi:tetratricopeptide (TPR) repeat protein